MMCRLHPSLIYCDWLISINKNCRLFQNPARVRGDNSKAAADPLAKMTLAFEMLFLDVGVMEMTRMCGVRSSEGCMARGFDLDPPTPFGGRRADDECDYFTPRTSYALELRWVKRDGLF